MRKLNFHNFYSVLGFFDNTKNLKQINCQASDANTEAENSLPEATVKLYFRNQMTTAHKTDESKLHELMRRHLKPVSDQHQSKAVHLLQD